MKDKHKKAYLKCAEAFAECSNATRLKVGTVIVKDNKIIGCGYNGMPEHIHEPCELPNGETDSRVRHSEMNALMGLLRAGISPVGSELFCTHSCCKFCAIDIVDAGIKKFYYKNSYRDNSGLQYLQDNNVLVEQLT
jgi:dCMP deaminase